MLDQVAVSPQLQAGTALAERHSIQKVAVIVGMLSVYGAHDLRFPSASGLGTVKDWEFEAHPPIIGCAVVFDDFVCPESMDHQAGHWPADAGDRDA